MCGRRAAGDGELSGIVDGRQALCDLERVVLSIGQRRIRCPCVRAAGGRSCKAGSISALSEVDRLAPNQHLLVRTLMVLRLFGSPFLKVMVTGCGSLLSVGFLPKREI